MSSYILLMLAPFLYSSSIYSSHIFVRSLASLSFIMLIFARKVSLICVIFLNGSLSFFLLNVILNPLQGIFKYYFISFLALLWNSTFRLANRFHCLLFSFYFNFFPILEYFLFASSFDTALTEVQSCSGTLSYYLSNFPFMFTT